MAELGDALALGASGEIRGGSTPLQPTNYLDFAGVAQLVEHNVANVVVVGSRPITRSIF